MISYVCEDLDGNKVHFESLPDGDMMCCLTCGWLSQSFPSINFRDINDAVEAHACEMHLNREPCWWPKGVQP